MRLMAYRTENDHCRFGGREKIDCTNAVGTNANVSLRSEEIVRVPEQTQSVRTRSATYRQHLSNGWGMGIAAD